MALLTIAPTPRIEVRGSDACARAVALAAGARLAPSSSVPEPLGGG